MKDKSPAQEGRFAYEGLNRLIHERARLSILTSLVTHPKGLAFNELKRLCALTDGNLNRHLSVLERGKMLEISKQQDQYRSQTFCRITASGRQRFLTYLSTLERVIQDAAKDTKSENVSPLARHLKPSQA